MLPRTPKKHCVAQLPSNRWYRRGECLACPAGPIGPALGCTVDTPRRRAIAGPFGGPLMPVTRTRDHCTTSHFRTFQADVWDWDTVIRWGGHPCLPSYKLKNYGWSRRTLWRLRWGYVKAIWGFKAILRLYCLPSKSTLSTLTIVLWLHWRLSRPHRLRRLRLHDRVQSSGGGWNQSPP